MKFLSKELFMNHAMIREAASKRTGLAVARFGKPGSVWRVGAYLTRTRAARPRAYSYVYVYVYVRGARARGCKQ